MQWLPLMALFLPFSSTRFGLGDKFDERTIAAIRQFQRLHRLARDGKAGESTLRKMKLGSD